MDLLDAAKSWVVASEEMEVIDCQGQCGRGPEATIEELRCFVLYPSRKDRRLDASCTKQMCQSESQGPRCWASKLVERGREMRREAVNH